MTLRKTIKWFFVILLLAGLGGGIYAYQIYSQANDRLRQMMVEQLKQKLPGWDIEIGSTRFIWWRRVHIGDVTARPTGTDDSLISLPEIVVTVDQDKLTNDQQVEVQKIRLVRPLLYLIRDSAGNWNWANLPKLPKSDKPSPELEIEQGTIRIRLEQTDGSAPTTLTVGPVDLQMIPSAKRSYVVKGRVRLDNLGVVTFNGHWNLDAKTWDVDGQLPGLEFGNALVARAVSIAPGLGPQVRRIDTAIKQLSATTSSSSPAASSAAESGSPTVPTNASLPDLGVSATLNVAVQISRSAADSPPNVSLTTEIQSGRITNPALPFPLYDTAGTVRFENRRLTVEKLSARNGRTQLEASGTILFHNNQHPGGFHVAVRNLTLDDRVQAVLPLGLRKAYIDLNPTGTIDLTGDVITDKQGRWKPRDVLATVHAGTCRHARFPYPLVDINGTAKQDGAEFKLNFEGRAGRRPVAIVGWIRNPGPAAEAEIGIAVDRLPLDDAFTAACPKKTRSVLNSLNLVGLADGRAWLYRPAGLHKKFQLRLVARIRKATMESTAFPLRLTDLTGEVQYAPEKKRWTFRKLKAMHGAARLVGEASFDGLKTPGRLRLSVTAEKAKLDETVRAALTPSLKSLWDDFAPRGSIDHLETEITWIPGQPVRVSLPKVEISDGGLKMRALPYPIDQIKGRFSYVNDRVEIQSFSGRHDLTKVRAKGYVICPPRGIWIVHLTEFFADDLVPDRRFRQALPADLKSVVEQLDPHGPISLAGPLEFRGGIQPPAPTTAAWNLTAMLSGNRISTGVDLTNVNGRVSSRGTWDGRQAEMSGKVNLDSVWVWGYQFTKLRGPYRLAGNRLTVGSPEALRPRRRGTRPKPIPLSDRITARAIGGIFTLDAVIDLKDDPVYQLKLTMTQGLLEQYARRYIRGRTSLKGVMTGWIDLNGHGTATKNLKGHGRLQIRPAALFELPVMAQVFKLLSLTTPDKTAFYHAYTDFTVGRERFYFNTIDLLGNAVSLRGRGTAAFNGTLNLDFYSMMPRNSLPIPIVKDVVGGLTTGWVGVTVRGTVQVPDAQIRPLKTLDDALRRFLGSFNPRRRGRFNPPRMTIPTLPFIQSPRRTPRRKKSTPRQPPPRRTAPRRVPRSR